MEITLSPEQLALLDECVETGELPDEPGAVRASVELLQAKREARSRREEEIMAAVAIGIAEADAGLGIRIDDTDAFVEDVKRRGRERLAD
jgi:Arc/MetJ-type ribon-helix-helix transcriptional regulator